MQLITEAYQFARKMA
ncbi:hypothetical protein O9929_21300 [Vibrio lentus]|nr:hypothetical protein [Vibrio lentus]